MDTTFLLDLLTSTDYSDPGAAHTAEWEIRRRTGVIVAARVYLGELRRLQQALGEMPAPVELPPAVQDYLREV